MQDIFARLANRESDRKLAVQPTTSPLHRDNSYHLQASVYQVIEELERSPDGTLPDLVSKVEDAVHKDFPLVRRSPTAENMEDAIYRHPSNPKLKFEQGQWCEYLGLDMKWHLGQVKRVVKVAPMGWKPKVDRKPDWDFCYSFQGDDLVPRDKVRAPEEALKREFGMRPWVWQQWAFLKVEDMTRFQRFHERDFETLNFGLTANLLFIQWLDDARNADFKQFFEGKNQGERDKLVDHLLAPFVLCDEISKDPHGDWDFNVSSKISLYLYPSLLGAGWISCLGALLVQCVIPAVLLFEALVASPRFDMANFTNNDFDRFCTRNRPDEEWWLDTGLVINIVVLIFYIMRNLPQVMLAFFDTVGNADTVNSRAGSLRALVADQGASTTAMQVGNRLERFMNSTYIALVNTLMLSVLFLTDIPSEIILNALSVEFVIDFDDELVGLRWIDPYFRYIRAATTELVFRYYIETQKLSSASQFCKEYDIPREYYAEAMRENDSFPASVALDCPPLAAIDSENTKYMLPKDVVWRIAGEVAKQSGNTVAEQVFLEHPAHFDLLSQALAHFGLCGVGGDGIFTRWKRYHTWSRWDKLLFVSPCGPEYIPPNLPSSGLVKFKYYLNDFDEGEYNPMLRFIIDSIKTLFLFHFFQSLTNAIRWRSPLSFVGRFFDGLVEWVSIFYLVIFPFTFPMFFIALIACY